MNAFKLKVRRKKIESKAQKSLNQKLEKAWSFGIKARKLKIPTWRSDKKLNQKLKKNWVKSSKKLETHIWSESCKAQILSSPT
jgi:hypothetical protein